MGALASDRITRSTGLSGWHAKGKFVVDLSSGGGLRAMVPSLECPGIPLLISYLRDSPRLSVEAVRPFGAIRRFLQCRPESARPCGLCRIRTTRPTGFEPAWFGFVERRPRLCGAQLPAASSARKVTVWSPSASPEKRAGLVQPPKDPESSMHITLATSKAGGSDEGERGLRAADRSRGASFDP